LVEVCDFGLEFADAPEEMPGAFPAHLAVEVFPAVLGFAHITVHALGSRATTARAGHGLAAFGRVGNVDFLAPAAWAGAHLGRLTCAQNRHRQSNVNQKAKTPTGMANVHRSHEGISMLITTTPASGRRPAQ
jgi:hypothetical protein